MDINIYKLLLKISSRGQAQEKNKLARIILSRDFYNQESKMPELFALLEINGINGKDYTEVVSLLARIEIKIIERIQKIYNSISSRKSFQTDNLSEHLLELILKSLNSEIAFCLEESNLVGLKDSINIFIGVLEPALIKNEIKYYFHFSSSGNMDAFLIFAQQDSYKIMDVLKENKDNKQKDGNKIFTNITSGEIDNKSFLVVCNKNLTDYIIVDKLKQIVVSMGEKEALKYLKNILSEADAELEFISIFISLQKDEESNILSPENSIEKLILTEKNTEKFLAPSIFPDFKLNFINFVNYIKKLWRKIFRCFFRFRGKILKLRVNKEKTAKNFAQYKDITVSKAKSIPRSAGNIKKYFVKIINHSARVVGYLIDACRNVLLSIYTKFKKFICKIKKISFFTKLILTTFIIALIFFWQGTIWLKNKKVKEENQIVYNEALLELEKKFDSLEASLIYNDFEKASATIGEIDIIMETTLARNIEEYKEKYDELSIKIDTYKKGINKVIELDNPQALNLALDNNSNIRNIVFQNKNLILFDNINSKVFKFELDKNTTILWDAEKKLDNFLYYKVSNDGIIAYEKPENKVYEFKDKKVKEIKTLLSGNIADVKKYAESVYALDTQNNQIFVYRYTKREPWIKDTFIELKDAISLAVDGNIFVLKENGEVFKYFKGKKENFSLQDIEPSLKSPSKLFTDADTKNLYIMDAKNRRIVVFEKECKDAKCPIIAQYTSTKFNDIRDFAVDEANKIIYVLNGNEIFKISLVP